MFLADEPWWMVPAVILPNPAICPIFGDAIPEIRDSQRIGSKGGAIAGFEPEYRLFGLRKTTARHSGRRYRRNSKTRSERAIRPPVPPIVVFTPSR